MVRYLIKPVTGLDYKQREDTLNWQSAEGWEFVTADGENNYIFKRTETS